MDHYTTQMKLRAAIYFLLLAPVLASANRDRDSFYVWQQQWSSAVFSAVSNEPATTLYPIAATVPGSGESRLVDIPWQRLAALQHRIVPVIRIPLKAFRRDDIGHELSRLTTLLLEAGKPCAVNEIQLDLDCPERLLPEYRKLIADYRAQWPDLHMSITALPCHLDNKTFRPLAEAVDSFTLQVHGLDVPGHVDEPAALLDLGTAERAIRQAEALGRPYRIALPCYAYELNFDAGSGKFLFLTAEHPAQRTDTIKKRIASKTDEVLKLLQEVNELKQAQGIIWFRLPVEGDRLCWPRATLAQLQQGVRPGDRITCKVIPVSDSTIELELVNENLIRSATAALQLVWVQPRGNYDLYHDIDAKTFPGTLPPELVVSLPPPGQAVRIGWFETDQPPTIHIELQ